MSGQPAGILAAVRAELAPAEGSNRLVPLVTEGRLPRERIGRASCRERV